MHCTEKLERGDEVSSTNGLWQLAAEMVCAHEENIRCIGEAAFSVVKKNFEAKQAARVASGEVDGMVVAHDAEMAGQDARTSAEAAMRETPVYGILTDFREWLFVRLSALFKHPCRCECSK